jgi:hypothetical protein
MVNLYEFLTSTLDGKNDMFSRKDEKNPFFCLGRSRVGPPLWSSGQSFWLQILRPGFDSRHYQKKKRIVGLERGPLSFVSTTEELLDRKVVAPV